MNEEKKWAKVSADIGYSTVHKHIPNLLRAHYERILYPYDVFQREEEKKAQQAVKDEVKEEDDDDEEASPAKSESEKEYKPHNIPGRMGMKVPTDKDKAGGGGGTTRRRRRRRTASRRRRLVRPRPLGQPPPPQEELPEPALSPKSWPGCSSSARGPRWPGCPTRRRRRRRPGG